MKPQTRPSAPVRVALVITDLDVGGAERAIVNLATGLDTRRWLPRVIALTGEGALTQVLHQAGVPYKCLGCRRHEAGRVVWKLSRALRKHRPLLVQSFLFHANLATRLAAPWAGRPWVLGGLRVAEREKRWHQTLDRLTEKLSAGSVCVSEGVLAFSQEMAGLNPRRLTVIPNGIEPGPYQASSSLSRTELGIPETSHLALFVGRLHPQKGLPDLLEAAEQVIGQTPDWHLALAGDGPDRNWLVERVGREPFAGRVHWLGARNDIPALLKTSDVVVLPSIWEGMPNVLLEAMAAGRAVIATSVEGTTELVLPGKSGWLVPPRQPQALAAALLNAARDPRLCERFGREGYDRVLARFSIDQTVAAYERLWSQVLGFQDT